MEAQQKNENYKRIEVVLWIVAVIMIIMVPIFHAHRWDMQPSGSLSDFSEGWYYLEDGQRKEIELPCTLSYSGKNEEGIGELTIYHDPDERLKSGMFLSTMGAQYQLRISVGDEVVYQYKDTEFKRNDQMASKVFCDVQLSGTPENETVSVTYFNNDSEDYSLSSVLIGTEGRLFRHYIQSDMLNLIIVALTWILGLAAIFAFIYMWYCGQNDRRFADVSFFLLICGTWCLTDSSVFNYIVNYDPAVNYISFYAFMLFPLPVIYFLKHTAGMERYRRFDIAEAAFCLNVIIQSALHLLYHIEFVHTLFMTHILLFGGVLWIGQALLLEYKKTHTKELQTILLSFVMLGAAGLLSLILYWLLEISFYESIFEIGIFLFIVILFGGLLRTATENMRYRTEMNVYERLAREDGLTGLKNRRAFEEFMAEFQMKAADYKGAVLVFLEVNHLKQINDSMGYSAGDEMLIKAAKCIHDTFSAMGHCYRLGDSEFCAVLLDPVGKREDWYGRLDGEIRIRNRESRIPLTIARGESYLQNPDGTLKSVIEWKFEADQRMHQNKTMEGRMKDRRLSGGEKQVKGET